MKTHHSISRSFATRFLALVFAGFTLLGCLHDKEDDTDSMNDSGDPVMTTPVTLTAVLFGAQEAAPVDTGATGYGMIVVDPDTRAASGGATFTGMTATAAHIHTGAVGASGGIAITLMVDNMTHSATIPAGTVLTQQQYDDLLAGNLYFNVHSSTNPTGEIRGQIGREVMTATLDGTQNEPDVMTAATGTARVVVDPDTLGVTGGAVFSGVTATVAHIHTGAAGSNGGIAVSLTVDAGAGTATIPGGTTLTPQQYDDLRAGKLYFNVHSMANPTGEIRGQIGPIVMVAAMSGPLEVPAVTTTATGQAVFIIDPVTRALSGGVGFTGMTATVAHIHTGAVGATGAPAVTLTVDNNTGTAIAPANTILTQQQYDDLLAGNLYVNVHSATHASGEIRGQLGAP